MRSWVADRVAPIPPPETDLVAKGFRIAPPTFFDLAIRRIDAARVLHPKGLLRFSSPSVSEDRVDSAPVTVKHPFGYSVSFKPLDHSSPHPDSISFRHPKISPDCTAVPIAVSSDYVEQDHSSIEIRTLELAPVPRVGADLFSLHTLTPAETIRSIDHRLTAVAVHQISIGRTPPHSTGVPLFLVAPEVARDLLKPFRPVRVQGYVFSKEEDNQEFPESPLPHTSRSSCGKNAVSSISNPNASRPSRQQGRPIWTYLLAFLSPPLLLDRLRPTDLPGTLYPFQIDGIRRLITNPSFLLADEMGTGKTVMTSVALRILLQKGRIRRALIVCPKSIISVWSRHMQDWAKPLSAVVVSGPKAVRQTAWQTPAHVYIASYDTIRSDCDSGFKTRYSSRHSSARVGGFDALVLDEAQAVRNPDSGRSRATRSIAQQTTYNWALTGTPIQKAVSDLMTLCGIVRIPLGSCPGDLYKTALHGTQPVFSPASIRQAIEPYFLRRQKKDVFPELPSKLRTDEWLELDPDQRREYESTLNQGRNQFRSGQNAFSRIHVFALLNRLKEICNFAKGKYKSSKTAALLEHVEDIVDSGKKLLVFTQYKEEGVSKLKPLLARYGVECMTGDSTGRERAQAVERFQNDPGRRVFLATLQTAGEGLTLTAASYVIHFDHLWNPAVAWQAEDRAHRKGQTEPVNVYSFWTVGTIEERIREILEKKGLLHKEIVEELSEAAFESRLTLDDLLSVLDLDRAVVRLR